jgi:hypothetical protein
MDFKSRASASFATRAALPSIVYCTMPPAADSTVVKIVRIERTRVKPGAGEEGQLGDHRSRRSHIPDQSMAITRTETPVPTIRKNTESTDISDREHRDRWKSSQPIS